MMISTKGRYALRILSDLAVVPEGEFASLKDISDDQNISRKYLEAIISNLLNEGLVESRRGRSGGYRLTKRPEEYSVYSILIFAEGTISPVSCLDHEEILCGRSEHCIAHPLWLKLDSIIPDYLKSITLKDLIEGNL